MDSRSFIGAKTVDSGLVGEAKDRISSGKGSFVGLGSVYSLHSYRQSQIDNFDKEKRIEIDPTQRKQGDDSLDSPSDSEEETKSLEHPASEDEPGVIEPRRAGLPEENKGEEGRKTSFRIKDAL